jgi:endo-1,4-beta-xylanase
MILCVFLNIGQVSAQPLANGYDKFLGNIIAGNVPGNWNSYWNQVTPENASKWATAEPGRDSYSWGGIDLAYNHALSRGIPFKFHTLIWGQQYPSWIMTLDSAQQAEEIEEWIRDVGQRYPLMDFVDVVNEPLANHAPAPFKDALGGNGATGYDWVIRSFELARQYCNPNVKLILNEYNLLNSDGNTTTMITIVNLLKARNLIDGIGIQGHYFEFRDVASSTIINNLNRLAATGLPIHISEFDVDLANDTQQLNEYKRLIPILWEHPGVKGITLWGYIQGQIWRVEGYLVRTDGSERPALQWLRSYLLSNGTYRSYQSGAWNDPNSWEAYTDTIWIHPASVPPNVLSSAVTILNGHTITLTASDSIDQLTINSSGKLQINESVNLEIKDGIETDLTVDGTILNFGSIALDDSAAVRFRTGSTYIHHQDGGTIPQAIWGSGSTCQIDSIQTTVPANMNQDFYHLLWNCPEQASVMSMDWNGITIGGNVTVQSTGTSRLYMCAPAEDDSVTVNINGNLVQAGGEVAVHGSENNSTVLVSHNGSITITGGEFLISDGSQGGTGSTVWELTAGNFSLSNAVVSSLTEGEAGARFLFSAPGPQALTLGSGITINELAVEVSNGTTLNMGSSVLDGSGFFILNDGATLECALAGGLDAALATSGTKMLSKAASYIFDGSAAQITGSFLPDTVFNLTLDNAAGVSLSADAVVNGRLDLKDGALYLDGHVLSYGPEGTLRYSGSSAQTTADAEFPLAGGPRNLIVSTSGGLSLHASRILSGNLDLGAKLRVGVNSITATSTSRASSLRYVVTNEGGSLILNSVGAVQQLFPVGVVSAYAPVWITNGGTEDTIGVGVIDDTAPAAEGGRVRVKWQIGESDAGDGIYILEFGWMPILEDATFKTDRPYHAKIFSMTDTSEAGEGMYSTHFSSQPYTVARGGFTTLGPFAVGRFGYVDAIEMPVEEVPLEFNLEQNYPNPFNPTTSIRYNLGKADQVQLIIYNVLGAQVRRLVNAYEQSGQHTVIWDARDEQKNPVASGVYFYRLVTSERTLQRKMLLVR